MIIILSKTVDMFRFVTCISGTVEWLRG